MKKVTVVNKKSVGPVTSKTTERPSTMMPNASTAPSQDYSNILSSLSSMAVKPVQDIIEREIDKYSVQARAKIAKERGIEKSKVPDLDVAEYLLGMPTANLSKPVADIATTLRNVLLFMTVAICTTIYVTNRKPSSRSE